MKKKNMAVSISVMLGMCLTLGITGMAAGTEEFECQKDVLTHAMNALGADSSDSDLFEQLYVQYYNNVLEMKEYETTDEMAGFFTAGIYFLGNFEEGTSEYELGNQALNALAELSNGNLDGFTTYMEASYEYYNPGDGGDVQEPAAATIGEENALKSAKSYLEFSAFSYEGLIEQLEYEKYSHEEAVYAADNCGADWNEQAVAAAKSYLEFSAFSRDGLIEQLEYEGFTTEQAVYGAEANGY